MSDGETLSPADAVEDAGDDDDDMVSENEAEQQSAASGAGGVGGRAAAIATMEAQIEQLHTEKLAAAEAEEYGLAKELKGKIVELEAGLEELRSAPEADDGNAAAVAEIEAQIAQLHTEKLAAAEEEEYGLAKELKGKIVELEAKLGELRSGGGAAAAAPASAAAVVPAPATSGAAAAKEADEGPALEPSASRSNVAVAFTAEGSLGIKFGKTADGSGLLVLSVNAGGQAIGHVLEGDQLIGVNKESGQPMSAMKKYLGSGERPAHLLFSRADSSPVIFTEEGSFGIKFGKNPGGGLKVVGVTVGAQAEGRVREGDVLLGVGGAADSTMIEMKPFLKSSVRPATLYFQRLKIADVEEEETGADPGAQAGAATAQLPPGRLSRKSSASSGPPPPGSPSGGSSPPPPGRMSRKTRRASLDGGAEGALALGKKVKVEIAGVGSLGLEFGVDCNSGRIILVNVLPGGIVANTSPGVLESLDRLDAIGEVSLTKTPEEAAEYKRIHGESPEEENDAAAQVLLDETIGVIVDTPRPFMLHFHRPAPIPPSAARQSAASGGGAAAAASTKPHNPLRYFRGKGFMYYQSGGLIKKWGPGYIIFNFKANVLNYWKSSAYPEDTPSFMLNLEGGKVTTSAGEPRAFSLTAADGKVHNFSAMDQPTALHWAKLLRAAIHDEVEGDMAHDILHGAIDEDHPVWAEPHDMQEEFIEVTRMKFTLTEAQAQAHDDMCNAAAKRKEDEEPEEPLISGGWLYKRGQQNTAWKLRHFELDQTTFHLRYFEKHTDAKPKGDIDLKACSLLECGPTADTLCGRRHSLVIKDGSGKLIKLCTASAGEVLVWYDAVCRVMIQAHSPAAPADEM